MNNISESPYLLPYIGSNIAGILFLWAAIKKPPLARLMFVLLFGWAAWVNYTTSHQKPEVYLEYASMSAPWLSGFITGWFSSHITLMVTVISFGQALIAFGMLLKGWWVKLSGMGIIIFLAAIAPLGIGSAFPFSITVSIAAWFIFKKDSHDYLWNFGKQKKVVSV